MPVAHQHEGLAQVGSGVARCGVSPVQNPAEPSALGDDIASMNIEVGPGDWTRFLKSALPKDGARDIGVHRVAEAGHENLQPKVEPLCPGCQRSRPVGVAGCVPRRGHVHLSECLPQISRPIGT